LLSDLLNSALSFSNSNLSSRNFSLSAAISLCTSTCTGTGTGLGLLRYIVAGLVGRLFCLLLGLLRLLLARFGVLAAPNFGI